MIKTHKTTEYILKKKHKNKTKNNLQNYTETYLSEQNEEEKKKRNGNLPKICRML